jgi:REP element-mobilizing transposase RayT
MSHSLTKIWIHAVFGTKYGKPLIAPRNANELFYHIKKHLEDDFNCKVGNINGTVDHVHILFLLNPNYTIKDIVKNVKGESSHWVNQKDIFKIKFAWQVGYGAFSVSESNVITVDRYIANQKEHHRKKTFLEEYEEFINIHGLIYLPETVQTVSDETE